MDEIDMLEKRRKQILTEMGNIRAMRRGSVTKQYLPARPGKAPRRGKKEQGLWGPYWLYTRKQKGKSVGQRLRQGEVERFRAEVEAYHQFQALCSEYADLTERLGEWERELGEGSEEKKRQRSPSRGTRR